MTHSNSVKAGMDLLFAQTHLVKARISCSGHEVGNADVSASG